MEDKISNKKVNWEICTDCLTADKNTICSKKPNSGEKFKIKYTQEALNAI
jgi:hypothetical protein